MATKIVSLGGSMINPGQINIPFLSQFREVILSLPDKFVIVTGGGKVCREYIEASKKLSASRNRDHDWIGIRSTELNGELVRSMFSSVTTDTIHPDYNKKVSFKKVLVGCGYLPGTSTDYDAVMYAINYKAKDVVNISNVDYVYDKDPRTHPDARPLKNLTWKEYRSMMRAKWVAGANSPFDPIAAKKAEKAKLRVFILSGEDMGNIKSCLQGKPFKGTIILP